MPCMFVCMLWDWPYLTSSHGMLTHTWYHCVNVIGAAQTLALHWCLLSSHCCQNGGGREQCLTHPWSHSHQPKQVHCVRPVSHGEDHCGEAWCGASSSHSLNISTPLLPSVQISHCWEVKTSFFSYDYCIYTEDILHEAGQIGSLEWGWYWWITWGFRLYFKGGDPKHWESGSPAKSVLMPACFLKSKSKTCLQVTILWHSSLLHFNSKDVTCWGFFFLLVSIAIRPGTVPHCSGVGHHPVHQLVQDCPAIPKTSQGKKREKPS